jgi:hypothetical protein
MVYTHILLEYQIPSQPFDSQIGFRETFGFHRTPFGVPREIVEETHKYIEKKKL